MFKKNDDDINLNKKKDKNTIFSLKIPLTTIIAILFLILISYGIMFHQYKLSLNKI